MKRGRTNGSRPLDRDVSVTPTDIPDAMRPHTLGGHKGDLARRLRMRDVVDADASRVLPALQEAGRRSRVVGLSIDLHRPHARPGRGIDIGPGTRGRTG